MAPERCSAMALVDGFHSLILAHGESVGHSSKAPSEKMALSHADSDEAQGLIDGLDASVASFDSDRTT